MTQIHDAFLVTSHLEIRALLRSIQEQGTLMRMHTEGRPLALVTTLLDIDDDGPSIVVDNSADEDFNRRLLTADEVLFETTLDKVRIVFSSPQVESCLHDNRPAFRLSFPESLRRVQRREFYRVDIPVTMPTLCTITGLNGKDVNVTAKDIGVGGISVIDDSQSLDCTAGTLYKNCRLNLPETGVVHTDIQVRRSHDETLPNGKKVRVIGCQFINLPNPMLILIQSYIGRLERKLSARFRGLD